MNLVARASVTKHKKWTISTLVACTLLTVLPGCGIPTLRNPLAGRELPDTFNGEISGENSAHVGIEEFFNDPILTNLITQGLTENYQLKILGEDIEIANNEVLRRRGAYLPFVNIGAGARTDKFSSSCPQQTPTLSLMWSTWCIKTLCHERANRYSPAAGGRGWWGSVRPFGCVAHCSTQA